MIARRNFLAAGVSLAFAPRALAGEGSRLSFRGSLEQGGLVIGRAVPGAKVTVGDRPVLVSPDGVFAFGFSYDCANPVRVAAQFADGTGEASDVTALVRQYEVQTINGLPEKLVTPPEEDLQRIRREEGLVRDARLRETEGTGFAEPFDWPFPGIISSVYGSQRVLNGKPSAPHLGVDIAAPEGTPIHAPTGGVVSLVGDFLLEGGITLLDHGHGVSTCYLHQSRRDVAVGDKVSRGDVIGLVGKTGRATGPHTHWGLAWFQVKLDPSRSTRTPEPPRA
ncbi:MAG TPA: M23 family metallopeptidase [Rhizomicrobium sp.]|nr:M23 family metallopeptidase [Rhizomicrobium sp.]